MSLKLTFFVDMNYFRVTDDDYFKYKTLSCRPRYRDILSGQLKCHKEYFLT